MYPIQSNPIQSNPIQILIIVLSLFLAFSCKSDLGINESKEDSDLFTLISPDTIYIHQLIEKENEYFSKRDHTTKEIVESDTKDIKGIISFRKFERIPNKFNSVEEYNLMLQVVEAEVELGLKELIIHEELEELLEIPFISKYDFFI